MRNIHKYTAALLSTVMILSLLLAGCSGRKDDGTVTITNVSYDPTREFYEKYNKIFESYYESEHGKKINVIQSHGGSGAQARSVVEGCNADVVTLALEHDIDLIQNTGLIDKGWIDEFSDSSAPYTSTIVLLVRKGNPKHISDWDDLVKKNVDVITPDPKSSGGACWNFLAALSYAKTNYDSLKEQKSFMKKLYENVTIMGKLQFFRHHLHPPDHSGTSAASGADQTSGSLFPCKTAGCIIQTDSSLHCNDNRWMPAYP